MVHTVLTAERIKKLTFQKHFWTLHLLETPQIKPDFQIAITCGSGHKTLFLQNIEAECLISAEVWVASLVDVVVNSLMTGLLV